MTSPTPASSTEFLTALRSVFLKWEKLRLLYNAVLLMTFLVVFFPHLRAAWGNWTVPAYLFLCGAGANLCFFAGPVAEAYSDSRKSFPNGVALLDKPAVAPTSESVIIFWNRYIRLADTSGRNGFVILRTGRAPPVALHHASPGRRIPAECLPRQA